LRGHALQVSPPFVITEAEITTMVDGFGQAIEDVAQG
jgi:adenosylmethionine-8-amino-7-oxononanoate aminotransferase